MALTEERNIWVAMNLRFIEHYKEIYVVVGQGYERLLDPPDIFYCIKLEPNIIRAIINNQNVIKIPISEAMEITDIGRIRTLWILYGS